jgi:hypothetical protein
MSKHPGGPHAIVRIGEVERTMLVHPADSSLFDLLLLLQRDAGATTLTQILFELIQTYRTYQSMLLEAQDKEHQAMVFKVFQTKLIGFFDKVISHTTMMPNVNKVAVAAKDFVKNKAAEFQPQLEELFAQEKFDQAVDVLVLLLKGNLNHVIIPAGGFWARLFGRVLPVDPVVDLLGSWLKNNRVLFKDAAGDGNPMSAIGEES